MTAKEALENIRVVLRDSFDFPFNITPEYKILKEFIDENSSEKEE